MLYAQIDEKGRCFAVSDISEIAENPELIPVQAIDALGKIWDKSTKTWGNSPEFKEGGDEKSKFEKLELALIEIKAAEEYNSCLLEAASI